MSNSVDPDETAHHEPSHLDLCCLQKPVFIACGGERVNSILESVFLKNVFIFFPLPILAAKPPEVYLAKNADPDQVLQNMASDEVLQTTKTSCCWKNRLVQRVVVEVTT